MTASAEDVAKLRLQLVDTGWNPIPVYPSTKKPAIEGWSTIEANEFHIENWARSRPAAVSTGLCCNKNYFAVDIDILSDNDLARSVMAVAFDKLGYTPFVRIGRAPKLLLVYRQVPGSITSTQRRAVCGSGDLIEILSDGKQFIAFGTHPDTHKPYSWISEANPLDNEPSEAPLVSQEDIDAFLDAVHLIMPLGTPERKGKHGGNGGDQPFVYNDAGLVADGRERLLRDCVIEAAREMWSVHEPLEVQPLADQAWLLFIGRAWLEDQKWSLGDAIDKARSTVRRIRDGTIKLDEELADIELFFIAAQVLTPSRTREIYSNTCEQIRSLVLKGLEHVV